MRAGESSTRRVLLGELVCVLAAAKTGVGQVIGPPQQQPNPAAGLPPIGPELSPETKARQEKLLNDERQKRLVADTDKLLALATQLHADVARTDKNILSLDVIHRCEEIEKLAHAIKDRMRG